MEPKDFSPDTGTCCSQDSQKKEPCNAQDASENKVGQVCESSLQALQAELNACKEASEQSQQRYIQVLADMQNYKRRMEKDQLAWTRRAQEGVLLQLLPIVDDFDRAIMEHKKHVGDEELSAWMVGFEMISKELYKFLKSVHVTEITEIINFDPELHEAVAQVESADIASGNIVEVIQKGYMLADQVLRPAKVTVAR